MAGQVRISTRGGVEPLWSPDGKSLYFRSPDGRQVFRAAFEANSESSGFAPDFASAERLFSGTFGHHNPYGRTCDISPDGKRFLVFEEMNPVSRQKLNLVMNWNREVEEKLAHQK